MDELFRPLHSLFSFARGIRCCGCKASWHKGSALDFGGGATGARQSSASHSVWSRRANGALSDRLGHFFRIYKMRDSPSDPTALAHFCFAIAAAVLLQAYFAVMVFPFLLAALAQAIVERRASLRLAVINIAVVYGSRAHSRMGRGCRRSWECHFFGLGVWTLFDEFAFSIAAAARAPPRVLARLVTWDGGGRTWDATGGQYDGYNYLGAGLIFLAVIQLTAWKMTDRH